MESLSLSLYIIFGANFLLAAWLFIKAANYSRSVLVIITLWTILQSAVGLAGFYSDSHTMTGRFPLLVLPPLIFMVSLFVTAKGKAFIDGLNIRILTILHIIRIPVEIVLFFLFVHHAIPKAMTFEGTNFDILSGLSAPLIYYFGVLKKKPGKPVLIAWNIACVLLLLNVATNAVLSLPARFHQFGYEQPDIALGYFPFLLLPSCLVPLVLFSNLAAIRLIISLPPQSSNRPSRNTTTICL
jgi:hypothetical protein